MKFLRNRSALPYLALTVGILALSFSSLFIRWANAPGTMTSFYRMSLATLVLLPFLVRKRRNARLSWNWRWLMFPLAGGLFSALDHALWSTATNETTIANATLLNNTSALWVALIAVLFLHERPSGRFWLGLGLTLGGAAVVLGSDFILHPQFSSGDLLALFSGLFYAGYFLVTQRARQKLDTLTYIWIVDLACALVLLGINLLLGHSFVGYDLATYGAFLGAALISQVTGYFSIGYALGHLPASQVAPTVVVQPVITALLAIPFAGELPSLAQWMGGLGVLAGIYLVNTVRKTGEEG